MSLLDTWAAYCTRHGYNFSVYTRGVDIILDSSDNYHYYEEVGEVGFDGLARDLSDYLTRQKPVEESNHAGLAASEIVEQ